MADPRVFRPNHLPPEATTFVGREREIVEIKKSLSATRLLTLTGVGGIGKTRLALKIGAEVLDNECTIGSPPDARLVHVRLLFG